MSQHFTWLSEGTGRMTKSVKKRIWDTDIYTYIIMSVKKRNKIAKLDTNLVNVLQSNKPMTFGIISSTWQKSFTLSQFSAI